MADEPPPDSPRPPVRMGLRVVARHSAARYGGRALARDVAESHRPKHLDAATRLSRSASPAPPPPAPAPAPPSPAAPESFGGPAAPQAAAPDAGFERPEWAPPDMSDFAAQWMFGDQQSAGADLLSMAQAEKLPEPSKEQKVARFIARGGLERSRGARIVEGAGTGTPISSQELGLARSPEESSAPTPKRLSTRPPEQAVARAVSVPDSSSSAAAPPASARPEASASAAPSDPAARAANAPGPSRL